MAQTCNCWVRFQSEIDRFGIRYGAHNPKCPTFRPSLDPVDMVADTKLRLQGEKGIGR